MVALFTGQYKSELTCATCGYASARFEPFSTLTLPLPEDAKVRGAVLCFAVFN